MVFPSMIWFGTYWRPVSDAPDMRIEKRGLVSGAGYGKFWFSVLLLGLTALTAYIQRDSLAEWLPIHYVRIEGELIHLDPVQVTRVLQSHLQGGYFAVDLQAIEQEISRCAWIDRVEAARVWPDAVQLKVVEQRPVAIWGRNAYLNQRGDVFAPGILQSHQGLPHLDGPSGQEKRLLTVLYGLNQAWKQQGVKVADLSLSARMAWALKLDNGLKIVFGKQDPVVVTERLEKLLPRLGEKRFSDLSLIDVRYANGLALVWKTANGSETLSVSRTAQNRDMDVEPEITDTVDGWR